MVQKMADLVCHLAGQHHRGVAGVDHDAIGSPLQAGLGQADRTIVPFAEAGELEQTLRARRLDAHGRVVMLEQRDLDTHRLAAAIDRATGRLLHKQPGGGKQDPTAAIGTGPYVLKELEMGVRFIAEKNPNH